MSQHPTTIHLWSINHKNAPTEVRELAHIDPEPAVKLMDHLEALGRQVSVIPVSTCNRTEIYLETPRHEDPEALLAEAMAAAGLDVSVFQSTHCVRREGLMAVEHLYRVTAGLESMMLGEPQIAGQVKDAYRLARKHYEPSGGLLRAFQGAFRAGKRVRSETRISNGAVSVAFAAVELARKFFARLSDHKALLVGAGETGALAARHFLQHEIGHLTVVNRSPERARELVQTLNAQYRVEMAKQGKLVENAPDRVTARPWDELEDALTRADVVLSTTGALEPVILPEMVHRAVKPRHGNPLFLLDIAVPRDIHPDVSEVGGAYTFGLDDLDEVIAGNVAARKNCLPAAEKIIEEELMELQQWLADMDMRPTVAEFRAYLEELKDKQVGFVRKKESDEVAAAVDRSLKQFIKKVLGQSVSTLKNEESPEVRQQDLAALRRMFAQESGGKQGGGVRDGE